ncbi:hypothetical protein KY358_03005 [Candidatus Woesearchaeota archaeon]|nr:hypothetical protein [Candidatus Woesearchaeota archaeon]
MMILLLRCPRCRNKMKYESRDSILTGKRKLCVYCNHSFKVRTNIVGK